MSELRLEMLAMPGCELGPENPLPVLVPRQDLHQIKTLPDLPADMAANLCYGRVLLPLPYMMQDGYTRQRKRMQFKTAVLENELLKAVFLLDYGGRLWSLYDKTAKRELVDMNPVFQPANLAIRNAWFAGGVEWNIGTIGHSPFTCSPLFAAEVRTATGQPVLRMYEFERIRQVPFQIDAYLDNEYPLLYVRVRIANPHHAEIPMYWWSNIAVPEAEGTRVVVPADQAYRFNYATGLRLLPVPEVNGVDVSYATNINRAVDFFFQADKDERPWITALDKAGAGLVQTSTALLKGRKLFVWGTGPGGRNWQDFLSEPGHAYIEIQAGLARTQMEHLPMPAQAEWEWLEVYGKLQANPETVHGPDWHLARTHVAGELNRLISREELAAEFAQTMEWKDKRPEKILHCGSGWGRLEQLRREFCGELPFCTAATPYDCTALGPDQAAWQELLENEQFPEDDVHAPQTGVNVSTEWMLLLEQSTRAGKSGNWTGWYHLGLMHFYHGDKEAAQQSWQQSVSAKTNPWALRNLALLKCSQDEESEGVKMILQAYRMMPHLYPLAVECGKLLLQAGRADEWCRLLSEMPHDLKQKGRIRLLHGRALLDMNRLDELAQLLATPFVVEDLREGETSFSDLWFEYHAKRLSGAENIPVSEELRARVRQLFPPPGNMDFRMVTDDATSFDIASH